MNDFNRKVEEASARINKSIAEVAATVEKETAELVDGQRARGPGIWDQSEQAETGGKNLWLDEGSGGTEEDQIARA